MNIEILKIVEDGELEATQSKRILDSFTGFLEQAQGWEAKARAIVITDASQILEMKQAREARLALKDIRVNADKVRKELKERSLREGKAIDGVANVIKALIVPIEEYLEKQEHYAEVLEEEQKRRIEADRIVALAPFVPDVAMFNLREMTEDGFRNLLTSSKIAFEQQKKAEKEAEEARVKAEEQDRIDREKQREENELLKAEAAVREKELDAERKKVEAERASAEAEKAAREKAERENERIKADKERENAIASKAIEDAKKLNSEYQEATGQIILKFISESWEEYVTGLGDDKPSAVEFKLYLEETVADFIKQHINL